MPEFLPHFIQEITNKSARILKDFENTESKDLYEDIFQDYWKSFEFKESEPTQKVVAIDSSIGDAPLFNGGSFSPDFMLPFCNYFGFGGKFFFCFNQVVVGIRSIFSDY